MAKRLYLRHTIPGALVAACAFAALCVGLFAYWTASERLTAAAEQRLSGAAETRAALTADYLNGLTGDIVLTAAARSMRDAVIALNNGRRTEAGNGDVTQILRKRYVDDNPHPPAERHKMEKPSADTLYDMAHQRIHAWMDDLRMRRNLADILLLTIDGQVLYSVAKGEDFARPAAAQLAQLTQSVVQAPQIGQVAALDFIDYGGERAAFLAAPVALSGPSPVVLAVLAFRLPAEALTPLVARPQGLGETGDAFVIGADQGLRSTPRHAAHDGIMRAEHAVETPLGLNWKVVVTADITEILAPVHAMRNRMAAAGASLLTLISAAGVFFARGVTRPLAAMSDAMQKLARGNRDLTIPATERRDEIGAMAQALSVFKEALAQADSMRRGQDRQNQLREQRSRDLDKAMREFEGRIGTVVGAVTQAAENLQISARTMLDDSETTQKQTQSGAEEADRTADSVNTVAAAATQLSASIDEIDRRMRDTGKVAGNAVGHADQAGSAMHKVVEASRQIEDVLKMISIIAGQTNLLALNATIEAARAGDAGKGFAVVAEEVKHLANKTGEATQDIAAQITCMRDVTDGASSAMQSIIQVVADIGRMAEDMTIAVQEQGNATREIAHEAELAAQATHEVNAVIGQVGRAALSAHDTAQAVMDSSHNLAGQAQELRREIESFLAHVADTGFRSADEPFIDKAQQTALLISRELDAAVDRGDISMDDLFDQDYRPIAGTNPQQYAARFVALTDRLLADIQESVLAFDPRTAFCVAVDGNGFLPTHNKAFSQPQSPDADWNSAHCRNRRIFDDQTGLDAARNTEPFLLQTYRRNMGGGAYVMMKDASAPIMVKGRHWGGLRIGYRVAEE